jgi:hypothetical protein
MSLAHGGNQATKSRRFVVELNAMNAAAQARFGH